MRTALHCMQNYSDSIKTAENVSLARLLGYSLLVLLCMYGVRPATEE